MNNFSLWFITGLEHITDLAGYDHILFLLVLCVAYTLRQWKSLLILITAFTVGHSITLALSLLKIVNIDTNLVEFLIPVTIILTCLHNLYDRKRLNERSVRLNYVLTLFFGLVHGLGFSVLLQSLLGSSQSILSPLFAFNIGLEAGQLIILFIILLFSLVLTELFKIRQETLNLVVSLGGLVLAVVIAVERFTALIN